MPLPPINVVNSAARLICVLNEASLDQAAVNVLLSVNQAEVIIIIIIIEVTNAKVLLVMG